MRGKLILPWGWGTGVNDLCEAFSTLFFFDPAYFGAVIHPAGSWWSQSKLVSTLGCHIYTEKKRVTQLQPSLGGFITIVLVRQGDTGLSPGLGVTATALRDLVLDWIPSLQAFHWVLGFSLSPSWRGVLWFLTVPNALCCWAWNIWH